MSVWGFREKKYHSPARRIVVSESPVHRSKLTLTKLKFRKLRLQVSPKNPAAETLINNQDSSFYFRPRLDKEFFLVEPSGISRNFMSSKNSASQFEASKLIEKISIYKFLQKIPEQLERSALKREKSGAFRESDIKFQRSRITRKNSKFVLTGE